VGQRRRAERPGRVGRVAGCWRTCRVVAGQDLLQHLGRVGRVDRFGPGEAVRVAVADNLQVKVVGDAAAGQHRVQLLPGLFAGGQAVHGVGCDPLGGVHGGGVAQLNRLGDIGGGQPEGAAVPVVLHRQVTAAADLKDGPPISVLHPIRRCQQECPVVGAGDHLVVDTGRVAVSQHRQPRGIGSVLVWFGGEPVGAGALVELADQFTGRGEHDRIQAIAAVGQPGSEDVLGQSGEVPDMDSSLVEVEAERFGLPVAEGEGSGAFAGVGEPVQLGEPERSVGVGDIAKDPAGADRAELLIVTDQPHTPAAAHHILHGGVQGNGVGHPGLINHHQRRPPNPCPVGRIVVVDGPGEFGDGIGVGVKLVPELCGGGRRRGEPDHIPAGFSPGGGQGWSAPHFPDG
jgi:hypothetical protein